MVYCAVKACKNYYRRNETHNLKFFRFPREENIQKQWINACGSDLIIKIANARVCSEHFTESDYSLKDRLLKTSILKRRLNKDAVPSINLHMPSISPQQSVKRKPRMKTIMTNEFIDLKSDDICIDISEDTEYDPLSVLPRSVACQTGSDFDNSRELRIKELEREVSSLKAQLKHSMEECAHAEEVCNSFIKVYSVKFKTNGK